MGCWGCWSSLAGEAVVFGVGDALQEVLSGASLTPAVIAEAIGEFGIMLGTLAALHDCYVSEGDAANAQKLQDKMDAMQKELDELKSKAG